MLDALKRLLGLQLTSVLAPLQQQYPPYIPPPYHGQSIIPQGGPAPPTVYGNLANIPNNGPAPYQYPQATPSAVLNASTQVSFVPYPSPYGPAYPSMYIPIPTMPPNTIPSPVVGLSLMPPPAGSTGSVVAAQLPQLLLQAPSTFNTSKLLIHHLCVHT
ncbi:hypothetical protein F5146DRAFT_1145842 [Armillaria mellea]|nr:hypothetical protein F5146DRAFT_1145842 [Armillaria mellea]